MSNLQELVSPQQANLIVILASIMLTLVGAGLGFWAARTRGLIAALAGPVVFAMWQFHTWITRYDPATGYFGLDKVWVLGLEIVVFAMWQFHTWITRYDPASGYFGLDKVWVLGLEIVVFIALGVAAGLVWSRVIAPKIQEKE